MQPLYESTHIPRGAEYNSETLLVAVTDWDQSESILYKRDLLQRVLLEVHNSDGKKKDYFPNFRGGHQKSSSVFQSWRPFGYHSKQWYHFSSQMVKQRWT